MPVKVALDSRVLAPVADALAGEAEAMFGHLGARYMIVAEVIVMQRTEKHNDSTRESDEAADVVKLRVERLELAPTRDDDEGLRQTLRVFHDERKARGTLDEVAEPTEEEKDRRAGVAYLRAAK